MLGVLRHSPIEVPGVNGKIYIDPAVLVLLPMLFPPQTTGFSRYDLTTPPVQRDFSLPMQPVFIDQSGTFVGNLAWITANWPVPGSADRASAQARCLALM